jgi:hypothetical protein
MLGVYGSLCSFFRSSEEENLFIRNGEFKVPNSNGRDCKNRRACTSFQQMMNISTSGGFSQGRLSGSQGRLSGSQGRLSGSQGRSSVSQGRLRGSQGRLSGSQGKLSGSQGRLSGSQGRLSVSQGSLNGSQGSLNPIFETLPSSKMNFGSIFQMEL